MELEVNEVAAANRPALKKKIEGFNEALKKAELDLVRPCCSPYSTQSDY